MPEQYPTMVGMHKLTSTTTGWIEGEGPACDFCGSPATHFMPLATGVMNGQIKKLWWCRPCETTWVA